MTALGTAMRRGLKVRGWALRTYFVVLIAVFVAAAGAAAFYADRQYDSDGRRAARNDARFAAQAASKELGDHMALVTAAVRQLAANPQITQAFAKPASCSLTFGGMSGPDASHLDLLRPNGTVACSSRESSSDDRPNPYLGARWLGRALTQAAVVAPALDAATGAQVAISSAPMPGGAGIVAGFVDLRSIGKHLASLYGRGEELEFVVTSGSHVITRSIDPGRWAGASIAGSEFVDATGSVERRDVDGVPRLYGESAVPGVGWRLHVGADKVAALAPAHRLRNRQLMVIAAGLVFVLIAAWLMYRNLVRPLRALSREVVPTGATPTPASVPVSGPAEVTSLAENLNALIESVNAELLERRRAEARSRAVLESALDAVITIDHEGRILEFSPAAEAMFGRTRADVVGADFAELLIPAADRERYRRGLLRFLSTGKGPGPGNRAELSALRADGSEFPAELAISRVALDGPSVFTGVVRDLSQSKRAERQLEHLAAIVESSRDAIVGRTLEGNVTSWNAAAETLFGYTAEEIVGRSVAILAPPELRDELDAINDKLGRGELVQFETVRVRKGGSRIDVESTISPVMDAVGRVVGASSISRDVTQRKQVEAALRASEARYRDLFENATDLIATVDLDSRFTSVNEAFVKTLGYTRDELIGRPLPELVPPEWHDRLGLAHSGKVAREVSGTVYEHEMVAKDGRRIRVEVASRLIYEGGRPVGTEAICRDITERRLLEEQLRQSQRLESVGQLAGGIAHDFNNLLTVIGGYAEAALEAGETESDDELRQIVAATDRATVLTRQLLAFSRRQVLLPRSLTLNDVVEGITPMLGRLLGEDVELVVSLDPDVDPVLADANQLEQVLVNLAVNARDAMPGGGRLRIATGNVELDDDYVAQHPGASLGPHAMLTVSDTGVGMDADTLARIFEPFFTTKALGSGTGLGLATVYGIVKQSGGSIWAYSEPGGGSTFKVHLPVTDAAPEAERVAATQIEAPTGSERILVVEDEEALRELVAQILVRQGYTIVAAEDGNRALELLDEQGPIDLLLTDLVMPQISGSDLAERVRERIPDVRVLYMSGYADESVIRHGVLEADATLLEKPFSSSSLARAVRDALDREAVDLQRGSHPAAA